MSYATEINIWLTNALFMLGLLLVPVGMGFCLVPNKMFAIASKMNKWISTDKMFTKLNKPRYKESYFYRHHRVFGALTIILSFICLYILTFYAGVDTVTEVLFKIAETEFEKWLFSSLYYILICAIVLAAVFGAIMFKRPSALKKFEAWSNHWIATDEQLEFLNNQKDLPDRVLPGNPRIFGLFVILGAIYIIWNTSPL